jgi:hypothetical protein
LQNVPCEFAPEKIKPQPAHHEKLRSLFRLWGFKGMLQELDGRAQGQQAELI